MPRVERKCVVPGCGRKHYAHNKCQRHYDKAKAGRALTSAVPKQAGPVSVIADLAWPDVAKGAPGGQRIALYTCPVCGHSHACAWLPFDANPGLKTALCRSGSALSPKTSQVYVLAPSPDRVLDAPPPEYRPTKRRPIETGPSGEVEVDKPRTRSRAEAEVERAWLGVL